MVEYIKQERSSFIGAKKLSFELRQYKNSLSLSFKLCAIVSHFSFLGIRGQQLRDNEQRRGWGHKGGVEKGVRKRFGGSGIVGLTDRQNHL